MQTMLEWHGHAVAITFTRNWLKTGYHHIEIRCADPLPVTETGYRSHFIQNGELEQFDGPEDFVHQWLDEAAQSKSWKQHVEDSRQLKLF